MKNRLHIATLVGLAAIAVFGNAQDTWHGAGGTLSLRDALKAGLERSPRLRAVAAEANAARAESRAARAMTLPQISANGYATSSCLASIVNSAPGVMPENSQLVPEGRYADINVMFMAPFYTGGLLQGTARSAAALAVASDEILRETQAEVALAIKDAYLRALVAAELESGEQAGVTAAEETVRITRARFEAGRDIEASVRRAEAGLAEARRALVLARSDRAKAVLDLLAEMGAPLNSPASLSDRLAFSAPVASLDRYIALARAQRGESRATSARVRAAEAQLNAARGSRGPQVYGFAMGDSFSSSRMGADAGYTVGLVASLPVFDAGRRRADADRARAMLERERAQLETTNLRVEREVRQSWIDVEAAAENYRTAITGVQAAQAAYDVAKVRYESGRAILVEQLDALATLTRARANLAKALYEHQIAVARLERAAGISVQENQGEQK